MKWLFSSPFKFSHAPIFSPRWLLIRGILLLGLFLILELAGFRDYTCVICGTSPTGNPADQNSIILGMFFVILYFGATMAAPIFLLSSLFSRLLQGVFQNSAK